MDWKRSFGERPRYISTKLLQPSIKKKLERNVGLQAHTIVNCLPLPSFLKQIWCCNLLQPMPIFLPKWVIYLVKTPWNRHNFASVNNRGTSPLRKPLQTLTCYMVWCHLLGGCLLKIHEGSPIRSLWVNAQVDI
jgi:hypothetical protein